MGDETDWAEIAARESARANAAERRAKAAEDLVRRFVDSGDARFYIGGPLFGEMVALVVKASRDKP